jgi:hypothetical protein
VIALIFLIFGTASALCVCLVLQQWLGFSGLIVSTLKSGFCTKNVRMTGGLALPTKFALPTNSAACPQSNSWATADMAGQLREVAMSENEQREANALENLPELERVCPRCEGKGKIRSERVLRRCSSCDGAGYQPTEIGEMVLELMRHNFRPMYEDMDEGDACSAS